MNITAERALCTRLDKYTDAYINCGCEPKCIFSKMYLKNLSHPYLGFELVKSDLF